MTELKEYELVVQQGQVDFKSIMKYLCCVFGICDVFFNQAICLSLELIRCLFLKFIDSLSVFAQFSPDVLKESVLSLKCCR